MNKRLSVFATALVALSLMLPAVPGEALGQGKGKGQGQGQNKVEKKSSGEVLLDKVISTVERTIIERYFGRRGELYAVDGSGKGLPPGLAKKASLPPGLAKQLRERGTLPPGLAMRGLPPDLLAELPYRKGQRFVLIDHRVVLIEEATNRVLDVIEGILFGS